jgi:hypothetical protein
MDVEMSRAIYPNSLDFHVDDTMNKSSPDKTISIERQMMTKASKTRPSRRRLKPRNLGEGSRALHRKVCEAN